MQDKKSEDVVFSTDDFEMTRGELLADGESAVVHKSLISRSS